MLLSQQELGKAGGKADKSEAPWVGSYLEGLREDYTAQPGTGVEPKDSKSATTVNVSVSFATLDCSPRNGEVSCSCPHPKINTVMVQNKLRGKKVCIDCQE